MNGAWPAGPRRGGPPQLVAADFGVGALQTVKYNPIALYALRGAPDTALVYADRSGNNRNLQSGAVLPAPDFIPGHTCVTRNSLARASDPAFQRLGEITVCARVWRYDVGAPYQYICDVGNSSGQPEGNTCFNFLIDSAGRLLAASEHGNATGSGFVSTLVPPAGRWVFVALRRNAAGDLFTIDMDAASQSGAVIPPTGGSISYLTVGGVNVGPGLWQGGIADIGFYPTRLTNAQITERRKLMMGIK